MNLKPFLFALPLLALAACKDDDDDAPKDTEKPVINLVSPAAGTTSYPNGSSLRIQGTVSDNDELHEVHITLYNKITNQEVIHYHLHQDAGTAAFDTVTTLTVADSTAYSLSIQAEDHAENFSEAKRDFYVKP